MDAEVFANFFVSRSDSRQDAFHSSHRITVEQSSHKSRRLQARGWYPYGLLELVLNHISDPRRVLELIERLPAQPSLQKEFVECALIPLTVGVFKAEAVFRSPCPAVVAYCLSGCTHHAILARSLSPLHFLSPESEKSYSVENEGDALVNSASLFQLASAICRV